jgi:Opioid growth factor receptor (OGFr) conserved region
MANWTKLRSVSNSEGEIVDDPIVSFYAGETPDSRGRKIEEIWNFNDRQLETVHDFIQWLFPLPTSSHITRRRLS